MCNCFNETQKNILSNLRDENPDMVITVAVIKPRISRMGDDSVPPKFGAYLEYYGHSKKSTKEKKFSGTLSFNYCPICGVKYE